MQEEYQKSSENLNLFLVFELNHKKCQERFFKIAKYVQEFFSLVVHHLTIFDLLVQKGFCVFPKIMLVIYAIFLHYVIIISF